MSVQARVKSPAPNKATSRPENGTAPAGSGRALPKISEAAPLEGGLDGTSLLGLIGSLAVIGWAIYAGGAAGSFLQLSPFLIVIIGTILVTAISFSWAELKQISSVAGDALYNKSRSSRRVARLLLQITDFAHVGGILELQKKLANRSMDPFLKRCINMVSDGLPAEEVEQLIRDEIDVDVERRGKGAAILRKAAEVAPSMGLIGTLVGLIQMLGNLQNPDAIGPAMAVALLTTFYGALLGSVILSPLASKVERNSDELAQQRALYMVMADAMIRRENPRRLEPRLNAMLTPSNRVKYFD